MPDPELVTRAYNHMRAAEEMLGGNHHFVRQRWEDAFGAVRVAMDLLREIYPRERDTMNERTATDISMALTCLQGAFERLDQCSADMLGDLMHDVLTGRIVTHEQLSARNVP
jgi:cytochrome c-type biogenesis protein CcmH/NrfF